MTELATVDEAIDLLNAIHEADPTVLPALVEFRVECNEVLAGHPTVQVARIGLTDRNRWDVGFLGILNGVFGVDERGWGFIAATFDNAQKLTGFVRTKAAT